MQYSGDILDDFRLGGAVTRAGLAIERRATEVCNSMHEGARKDPERPLAGATVSAVLH